MLFGISIHTYGSRIFLNSLPSPFELPAGYYYYHDPSASSNIVVLLDSEGEIFCRFADPSTSPAHPHLIFFGPNIHFDIGQRDSTEE